MTVFPVFKEMKIINPISILLAVFFHWQRSARTQFVILRVVGRPVVKQGIAFLVSLGPSLDRILFPAFCVNNGDHTPVKNSLPDHAECEIIRAAWKKIKSYYVWWLFIFLRAKDNCNTPPPLFLIWETSLKCFMLDFETSKSYSEVSKSRSRKITSFSKTKLLQREPFLTIVLLPTSPNYSLPSRVLCE